jgi:DNA mismatch repair protein MSH2
MAQNFYKVCLSFSSRSFATNGRQTNSILKFYGAKADQPGTPYCNFSTAVACSFLRDALTSKQLRIQIYVKDGVSKVKLDKQASPGNLQAVESMLFNTVEILSAPIVAAIQFSIKANAVNVGVAYADSSSREIGISQFQDNESFSNVESFIIQLGVKEMLMMEAEKDEDAAKLRTLVERCNVVVTTRKKGRLAVLLQLQTSRNRAAEFKDTNIEQDLTRLVQDSDKKQLEAHYTQKEAMASCAALISYLSLDSDESNSGAFRLLTHDLAHYMRLDASAVKALHLMPDTLSTGNSNKNTSVFGVLNKCKTAQGTRLLAQWLKQPLVNLHEIGACPAGCGHLVDRHVQKSAKCWSSAWSTIPSCDRPSKTTI